MTIEKMFAGNGKPSWPYERGLGSCERPSAIFYACSLSSQVAAR
jgi:hypothetical protein